MQHWICELTEFTCENQKFCVETVDEVDDPDRCIELKEEDAFNDSITSLIGIEEEMLSQRLEGKRMIIKITWKEPKNTLLRYKIVFLVQKRHFYYFIDFSQNFQHFYFVLNSQLKFRMTSYSLNLPGLVNLGYTCYFNTTVQLLYHLADFNFEEQESYDEDLYEDSSRKNNYLFLLKEVFKGMKNNLLYKPKPKELIPWSYSETLDISFYFKFLFQKLGYENGRQFNISLQSKILFDCGCYSQKKKDYFELLLEIPNDLGNEEYSIYSALKQKSQETGLIDCTVHGKTNFVKNTVIHPQKLLFIKIKREENDKKITGFFSYPLVLNLKEFSKVEIIFDLVGVVFHTGSVTNGHYYCTIKQNNGWFKLNDNKISKANEQDYLFYGGKSDTVVYFLVYKIRPQFLHLTDEVLLNNEIELEEKHNKLENLPDNPMFYKFNATDIPKFINLSLFNPNYPKVILHKTYSLGNPGNKYIYMFKINEESAEYVKNLHYLNNDIVYEIISDSPFLLEKNYFYIKKYKKLRNNKPNCKCSEKPRILESDKGPIKILVGEAKETSTEKPKLKSFNSVETERITPENKNDDSDTVIGDPEKSFTSLIDENLASSLPCEERSVCLKMNYTEIDSEYLQKYSAYKKLYFLLKYKKSSCNYIFPQNLEFLNHILLDSEDFSKISYFQYKDNQLVEITQKNEFGGPLADFTDYQIVLENYFITLIEDSLDYLILKDKFDKHTCLLIENHHIFIKRSIKCSEIQEFAQAAFLSSSLEIDWQTSFGTINTATTKNDIFGGLSQLISDGSFELKPEEFSFYDTSTIKKQDSLIKESLLTNDTNEVVTSKIATQPENYSKSTNFYTAKSQETAFLEMQSKPISLISSLKILEKSDYTVISVGFLDDSCINNNINLITHIHPIYLKRTSTVNSLTHKLKALSCINHNFTLLKSIKDTDQIKVLGTSEDLNPTINALYVATNLYSPFIECVYLKEKKFVGYPFILNTTGLINLGELRLKYSIDNVVINKRTMLVMEDHERLVSMIYICED